ncbi:MAG: type II toxin-antitoxin system VapC family toxin [Candidatus Diapherotrites archaeon]|nr:type II toxin-antitoxin system VapC family toxin [Candidatus Diapherotrites archaeon]
MIIDASGFVGAIKYMTLHKIKDPKTVSLIKYELGNIVWKMQRWGDVKAPKDLLATWLQAVESFEMIEPEYTEVLTIATKTDLSFYDAAYLWLAKQKGEPILTMDKDFEKKWDVIHPKDL